MLKKHRESFGGQECDNQTHTLLKSLKSPCCEVKHMQSKVLSKYMRLLRPGLSQSDLHSTEIIKQSLFWC
jgi:hypothetical protein